MVQINASLHFEPSKINIFHRDCKRSGRDATCLAAFLCFTPVFLAPHFETDTVGKPGTPLTAPPAPVSPVDFGITLLQNLGFWETGFKGQVAPQTTLMTTLADLIPRSQKGTSPPG